MPELKQYLEADFRLGRAQNKTMFDFDEGI